VAETRQWFDGPIALSGAIANGRAIRAARFLGADFAYIGSAFIATKEANAVERYKEMITASGAEDIVYSNLFTGVHGNYLKPSIVAAGMDPENLPQSDASKMSFGTDASGERAKAKAWKDIWGSGQGVGSLNKVVPATELIARFKKEYEEAVDPPL
jgi:nitronate monooxygenase